MFLASIPANISKFTHWSTIEAHWGNIIFPLTRPFRLAWLIWDLVTIIKSVERRSWLFPDAKSGGKSKAAVARATVRLPSDVPKRMEASDIAGRDSMHQEEVLYVWDKLEYVCRWIKGQGSSPIYLSQTLGTLNHFPVSSHTTPWAAKKRSEYVIAQLNVEPSLQEKILQAQVPICSECIAVASSNAWCYLEYVVLQVSERVSYKICYSASPQVLLQRTVVSHK